jgi:hypothetical protein
MIMRTQMTIIVAVLSLASRAGADEDPTADRDPPRVDAPAAIESSTAPPPLAEPVEPQRDRPAADVERTSTPGPRPWLYLDDPTLPKPFAVTVHTAAGFTNAPPTERPFAFDVAHRGAIFEGGADVGLLSWLALTATIYGSGADGTAAAYGGVRFALLPADWSAHLVLSAGAMRDLSSTAGAWASAAYEQDIGRFRLGTTWRAGHSFAEGRDAVDVTASAGASVGVTGPVRAGVEWIGTDLEGAVDHDEAEGGMRHFAGPTASVELLKKRLSVVGGPAFGITRGAPPLVGRLSAAYAF